MADVFLSRLDFCFASVVLHRRINNMDFAPIETISVNLCTDAAATPLSGNIGGQEASRLRSGCQIISLCHPVWTAKHL